VVLCGVVKQSNGIYVRQNYGMEYEVGVGVGGRLWKATFHLPVKSWTHLTLTFSQFTGLKVKVTSSKSKSYVSK